MAFPLGYVPKTKTHNVIPLWTGLGLFIQVYIFLHCCPSCLQAPRVPALPVEGSCISGPCSSCASKAAVPGGVTWLHSDPHRRWLIWVVGKQSPQISGFQWLHLVRCTAQLNLHCLKINYTATSLKETLTMCLEKIVAHSVNLQCLCIRSIIDEK